VHRLAPVQPVRPAPLPAPVHDRYLGSRWYVRLQALQHSSRHQSQALSRYWGSSWETASHWFSQPGRCSSVLDFYQARRLLCCSASMSSYACSSRTSSGSSKAHPALCLWDSSAWPLTSTMFTRQHGGLFRCRLGRMPRHTEVHFWVCCLPRWQSHLIVFEAAGHRLPF
jgi:hypothetical protein